MNSEGTIRRTEDGTVVEIVGNTHLANLSGVTCVNPGDPEDARRYQKLFVKKKIYLPDEYDQAIAENLSGTDVIVLGMNGYSSLTEKQCKDWGVKVGAYEAACRSILVDTIRNLQSEFMGANIRLVHGASDMGVDRSTMEVAAATNLPQLGFNCPKFMFYVNDDEIPVYVSAAQNEYAQDFVRSLNILIAANGRAQAFEHDLAAAFKYHRHVIPINIIKSISTNGGPPAITDGKIEDAVAAMELLVHMVTVGFNRTKDPWKDLLVHLQETTVAISRQLLSPRRAFGIN